MKKILILGAGTAGTMMANHLHKKINKKEWSITIVDQDNNHYYQPGFLFLPFDIYSEKEVVKKRTKFFPKGIEYIQSPIKLIKADKNHIILENNDVINYDILIVATGNQIAPEAIDGIENGWREDIFDFYTFEGAVALRDKLKHWEGGKLVIHKSMMPVKCPVAPIEFAFLAEWYFNAKRKMRDKVEITYVNSLPKAFPKPKVAQKVTELYKERDISMVNNFEIDHIDGNTKQMVAKDGSTVDYDILVTVPPNKGAEVIGRSGLGNQMNYIPTDQKTLQSKQYENVFALGDATDLPGSKAGSTAHFQGEILLENIMSYINGKPLEAEFDGHANCYIESGYNKAMLIDFNYEIDPVEGTFPLAGIGPFSLLKETKINHYGKMAFKHIYWKMLLKGTPIPTVPPHMKTAGKKIEQAQNK